MQSVIYKILDRNVIVSQAVGNRVYISFPALQACLLSETDNINKAFQTGFDTGVSVLAVQQQVQDRSVFDPADDHLVDHGVRTAWKCGIAG